jgi:DNA polymerase elongation subunit (family B)
MITKNQYIVKKWFANEKEALGAFYQKLITLHTPILVRYKLDNFHFKIENGKLKILENINFLNLSEKEIIIYKMYNVGKEIKLSYLITNLGIFTSYEIETNKYILNNIFLETTPGRLIFSINFKNSIKQ